jgi:hypothetical protein
MSEGRKCECRLCKRSSAIKEAVERANPLELSALLWKTLDDLEHAETDRDVNAAQLAGNWPPPIGVTVVSELMTNNPAPNAAAPLFPTGKTVGVNFRWPK